MQKKIALLILLAGLVPLLVIAAAAHYLAQESLTQSALARLESAGIEKETILARYFSQKKKEAELLAQTLRVDEAPPQLPNPTLGYVRDSNHQRLTDLLNERRQDLTILAANQVLAQSMATIDWVYRQADNVAGGEKWTQIVNNQTPWLDDFRKVRGFDDLFLISLRGDIFFTSTRGREQGTNIKTGPGAQTPLGHLFPLAINGVTFWDSSRVVPDRGAADSPQDNPAVANPDGPASAGLASASPEGGSSVKNNGPATVQNPGQEPVYLGAPVQRNGKLIGVVAVRFSPQKLLGPLLLTDALPQGASLLLVGPDRKFRVTPLIRTGKDLVPLPDSPRHDEAIDKALAGETGLGPISQGESIHQAAWRPLQMGDQRWALVVEGGPASGPSPEADGPPRPLNRHYLDISGYYDLFLIHPNGDVLHTAARQKDYGTNLLTGPYADTNLGRLFRQVLKEKKVALSDVAPYGPSHDQPAAFVAAPLLKGDEVIRVVALQLPMEAVSGLLQPGDSLGDQGDIYLVGADKRMRSDSHRHGETHSVSASFRGSVAANGKDIPAVLAALEGKTGTLVSEAEGKLYGYRPFSIDSFTWALVLESRPAGGQGAVSHLVTNLTLICLAFALLVLLVAWIGARQIVRPLAAFTEQITQLSQGSFALSLSQKEQTAMGGLGGRVSEMAQRLGQMAGQIRTAAVALLQEGERLSAVVQGQSRSRSSVTGTVNFSNVYQAVQALDASMEEADKKDISNEQTSELTAIDVAEASNAINEAVLASRDVSERIYAIEEISRQVRLLAMNAAVEAARSGVAGDAFIESAKSIRKLAEQSRIAASELHRLSTSNTRITRQAGELLGTLTPNIQTFLSLLEKRRVSRDQQRPLILHLQEELDTLIDSVKTQAQAQKEQISQSPPQRLDRQIEQFSQKAEALQEALASFILPPEDEKQDQARQGP